MREPWHILLEDASWIILYMFQSPMFQGADYLYIGLILLVCLTGVILLVLLARRPRKQPRCRKCGFDMRGSTSLVCSECGWQAHNERILHSNARILWLLVPLLLICMAWPGYKAIRWSKERGWTPPLPRYKVTTLRTISTGHVYKKYTGRNPHDVQAPSFLRLIDADGQGVWQSCLNGERWQLHVNLPEDITGDGKPDIVLESCSSGTGHYGGYLIHHFETDGSVTSSNIAGYCGAAFKDFDGDGLYEIRMWDGCLKYALACGACLNIPDVILQCEDGEWIVAPELMRKPPPDSQDLDAIAMKLGALDWSKPIKPDDTFPYSNSTVNKLWNAMLPLVYSGNGRLAIELHRQVWPKNAPYREDALKHFLREVRKSTRDGDSIVNVQDPPIDWPEM